MNDFRKLVSSAVRCPFGEKNNVGVAEIKKGTIIRVRTGKEIRFRFWLQRGQGWQGSKMQAYWLVVRVLLTPPAAAAASQKWKIIYL
jgi:hypothetical protein